MDTESPSSQTGSSLKPKSSGLFRNRPSWAKAKSSPTMLLEAREEGDMFSKSNLIFARIKEENARRAEAEKAEQERKEQEELRLKERKAKRRKISNEGLAVEDHNQDREQGHSPKRKPAQPAANETTPKLFESSLLEKRASQVSPRTERYRQRAQDKSNENRKPSSSPVIALGGSASASPSPRTSRISHSHNYDKDGYKNDQDQPIVLVEEDLVLRARDTNHNVNDENENEDRVSSWLRTSSSYSEATNSKGPLRRHAASDAVNIPVLEPPPKPDKPNPVIEIFVWSRLPNTNPLICKRRIHQDLMQVKQAWIDRNSAALEGEIRDRIFLINAQRMRLYDFTTPASLGIEVNEATGEVFIRGKESQSLSGGIQGRDDSARVSMEAVTEESLREFEEAEKADKAQQARAVAEQDDVERVRDANNVGGADYRVPLIMRARGYEEWKVRARPTTRFNHLINNFRRVRQIPEGKEVFLMFDGDRLDKDARIESTDIGEMDHIDVHVK